MARLARRCAQLADIPLFSLARPWSHVAGPGDKLSVRFFEQRYVELIRRIEAPEGTACFGYSEHYPPKPGDAGVLTEANSINWLGPLGKSDVTLTAHGKERFRIVSVREDPVGDEGAAPLYVARVQLLDIQRIGRSEGASLPDTPFGRTFVQRNCPGFASLHFEADGSAYVSYESRLCSMLPALDDGTKLPNRKLFEASSYDEETRTFRATLTWAPATWGGAGRWDYEVVFAEDCKSIVSGEVRIFTPGGDMLRTLKFDQHFHYRAWNKDVCDSAETVSKSSLLNRGTVPAAVPKRFDQSPRRRFSQSSLARGRRDLANSCRPGVRRPVAGSVPAAKKNIAFRPVGQGAYRQRRKT